MENKDLFGNEVEPTIIGAMPGRNKSGSFLRNPLLSLYGELEGKKCKTCIHLVAKRFSKTYYKCELRNNVDKQSTKSDHKITCRKW